MAQVEFDEGMARQLEVLYHRRDVVRRRRFGWDRHLTHPSLPQTPQARLHQAGFSDVIANGHAFVSTALDPRDLRWVADRDGRPIRR